ncbi:MAG: hypothetical protein ACRC6E_05560, partial [Fusobacteriaceae bacterium]
MFEEVAEFLSLFSLNYTHLKGMPDWEMEFLLKEGLKQGITEEKVNEFLKYKLNKKKENEIKRKSVPNIPKYAECTNTGEVRTLASWQSSLNGYGILYKKLVREGLDEFTFRGLT